MRAIACALVLVLAPVAGCSDRIPCKHPQPPGADCSYGAESVEGRAVYPVWNASKAHAGAQALGAPGALLEWQGADREGYRVAESINGSMLFAVTFHVYAGLGYTGAEAQQVLNESRARAEPRFESLRAQFESAAGLPSGAVEWTSAASVA